MERNWLDKVLLLLCVGRILLANEKIGYNWFVWERCWKNHISFVKIIVSLKYFLFIVVGQHLCDTQNLVQIGPGISEEMWRQTNKQTNTHILLYNSSASENYGGGSSTLKFTLLLRKLVTLCINRRVSYHNNKLVYLNPLHQQYYRSCFKFKMSLGTDNLEEAKKSEVKGRRRGPECDGFPTDDKKCPTNKPTSDQVLDEIITTSNLQTSRKRWFLYSDSEEWE